MGYRDEELLRMQQRAEEFKKQQTAEDTITEECKQSIHDPVVYITKIPVKFENKPLLDGRIVMKVPADFDLIPSYIIDQVFVMQFKPQYAYENAYLPFGLTFTLTDISTDDQTTETMFPFILSTVKKIGPNVRVLETGKTFVQGVMLRWFEAISQTLTEPSYRIVFVFALKGKVTICNLTCPSSLQKRYKPIMKEMIETLQIVEETTEGEEA